MAHDDDTIDWNTVPPAKMFHIVMQELVDTRNELKQEFKSEMNRLEKKIDAVGSDLSTLRLEVHQNHTSFIANNTDLNKRVKKLEEVVFH